MYADLNSLLLEGIVKGEPQFSAGTRHQCVFFIIVNLRDAEGKIVPFTFEVNTYDLLAISCSKNISDGRGVRIVGRLVQENRDGVLKVVIIPEHVEYKPIH